MSDTVPALRLSTEVCRELEQSGRWRRKTSEPPPAPPSPLPPSARKISASIYAALMPTGATPRDDAPGAEAEEPDRRALADVMDQYDPLQLCDGARGRSPGWRARAREALTAHVQTLAACLVPAWLPDVLQHRDATVAAHARPGEAIVALAYWLRVALLLGEEEVAEWLSHAWPGADWARAAARRPESGSMRQAAGALVAMRAPLPGREGLEDADRGEHVARLLTNLINRLVIGMAARCQMLQIYQYLYVLCAPPLPLPHEEGVGRNLAGAFAHRVSCHDLLSMDDREVVAACYSRLFADGRHEDNATGRMEWDTARLMVERFANSNVAAVRELQQEAGRSLSPFLLARLRGECEAFAERVRKWARDARRGNSGSAVLAACDQHDQSVQAAVDNTLLAPLCVTLSECDATLELHDPRSPLRFVTRCRTFAQLFAPPLQTLSLRGAAAPAPVPAQRDSPRPDAASAVVDVGAVGEGIRGWLDHLCSLTRADQVAKSLEERGPLSGGLLARAVGRPTRNRDYVLAVLDEVTMGARLVSEPVVRGAKLVVYVVRHANRTDWSTHMFWPTVQAHGRSPRLVPPSPRTSINSINYQVAPQHSEIYAPYLRPNAASGEPPGAPAGAVAAWRLLRRGLGVDTSDRARLVEAESRYCQEIHANLARMSQQFQENEALRNGTLLQDVWWAAPGDGPREQAALTTWMALMAVQNMSQWARRRSTLEAFYPRLDRWVCGPFAQRLFGED